MNIDRETAYRMAHATYTGAEALQDILLRTHDGWDGVIPINTDEVKEYGQEAHPEVDLDTISEATKVFGKELFAEALTYQRNAVARRKRRFELLSRVENN